MTVVDPVTSANESADQLDRLADFLVARARETKPKHSWVKVWALMTAAGEMRQVELPDDDRADDQTRHWHLVIFEAARHEEIVAWGSCLGGGPSDDGPVLKVEVDSASGATRAYGHPMRIDKGKPVLGERQLLDQQLEWRLGLQPPQDGRRDELHYLRGISFPEDWTALDLYLLYEEFEEADKTEFFKEAVSWIGGEFEYDDGEVCKIIAVGPCEPGEPCFEIGVEDGRSPDWICSWSTKIDKRYGRVPRRRYR